MINPLEKAESLDSAFFFCAAGKGSLGDFSCTPVKVVLK